MIQIKPLFLRFNKLNKPEIRELTPSAATIPKHIYG